MRKYKEEYIGRTRLTQAKGSQVVTVWFPKDIGPGKPVQIPGVLSADKAGDIYFMAARKDEGTRA